MKEKTLNSWEIFEKEEIPKINEQTNKWQQEQTGSSCHMMYPLFRGQSDSGYHLKSTLDRIKENFTLLEYNKIIKIIHKQVETCTGRKWDIDTKVSLGLIELPAYEFMAYLRHNGFPSPLVDWTKSPYIAAFFAFRDICSKAEYISIFAYRGDLMQSGTNGASIWRLGPTIATCPTHYRQQSEYTICVRREEDEVSFSNYEDVKWNDEGILIKYKIPTSERQKILRRLDSINITAYSLFNSEPSLMETMALRKIYFEL